jgi:Histidine kinase-, DNA gyrase B-, and HSP90-like ATPase
MTCSSYPIVAVKSFIEATRDTGYKSTGSAIAELVDNAFEANASRVDIEIEDNSSEEKTANFTIRVTDNGRGMVPSVLALALQFGGSTRFRSRTGTGRYGMGLPNGGLSQARRVDVFSWTNPSQVWSTYLDVDEIASGQLRAVPKPHPTTPSTRPRTRSGTTVALTKCDRLDFDTLPRLESTLSAELGRVFRKFLTGGSQIRVNGNVVAALDPLFLGTGMNPNGATLYGPPLEYNIRVPNALNWHSSTSKVTVRFSELPIEDWHGLSNAQKNALGIAKKAGVSILRAGREIDYGWYFMGTKRRENYDDWWRCEVAFDPELDELFGVIHSKQKINPTEIMASILTPEMERIARELNGRVRRKYAAIHAKGNHATVIRRLQAKDHLLEPPSARVRRQDTAKTPKFNLLRKRNDGIQGLRFSVSHAAEEHDCFYSAILRDGRLSLTINERHPFYSGAYIPLSNSTGNKDSDPIQPLLLLLVSCARAECTLNRSRHREIIRRFREIWSDTVAAYLS